MKQLLSILTILCFGILSAQTYRIGDVYTAPDGSQGIVYYLHPDGSGGWVVALTDASTGCAWGASTDVPELSNQNSSYDQNLLNDTAGYANTQTLRSYQNNSTTYAAGKVDFAHGWVLPSPAQLFMLYGQLPFIASAITGAGGTALAYDWYWCSAEKDAFNAWRVDFGSSSSSGYFTGTPKTTSCRVRAVRSFTYTTVVHDSTLTYLWNTGSTQPYIEVSPSQTTTYTVTATTEFGCSNTAEQTILVGTGTSQTIYDTVCQGSDYEANGFTLTSAETGTPGTLTRSRTLETDGCNSTITLQLTVKSTATELVEASFCENYTWNGVTYYESGDYTQTFTAANGCDSVVTLHLTLDSASQVHITGSSYLCEDSTVELTVDSSVAYLWSTGETVRTIQVDSAGAYSVTVMDENGCTSTAWHHIAVLENPISSVDIPEMCAGGSYTLTVGHNLESNVRLLNNETTLSKQEIVFLPDGIDCEPYGSYYRSYVNFTSFAPNDTISSADDILYVRLKMEHSSVADLQIQIFCPNNNFATILPQPNFESTYDHSTSPATPQFFRVNLGSAYRPDGGGCSANLNPIGEPWNYIWSNNSTLGYQYASDNGNLSSPNNFISHYNPHWDTELSPFFDTLHSYSVDSTNVAQMSQVYHPYQSFSSLVGCPLNGNWYIQVQDMLEYDNGYLVEWELALNPETLPLTSLDYDYVTMDGPWVTTLNDSSFVVNPPADLEHDTVISYTITVHYENGCEFDTTVDVTVYAASQTLIDTAVCERFTWSGDTLTQSGEYTHTLTNAAGCDSLVILQLGITSSVAELVEATACGSYSWNDSVYTASGDYPQTFIAANGCDSVVTLHLTIIPLPELSHTLDTVILTGTSATLWASGADVLYWSDSAGNILASGLSLTVSPNTSTMYYLTGQNQGDCSVTDSVYVYVTGYPDNVDSADCVFFPEGTEWSIAQPIISNVGEVVTVSTPMIGDIDDDGHQEIVISSAPGGYVASKMDIFNSDGSLKLQFNIVGTHVWNSVGLAKVKWDNNSSKTIIVVYGTNNYLYAYDANGVQLWQSDQPFSSHNGETYNTPAISFADFNHDGWSEVYVGSEIFDAATGVLLCKTNGNKGGADRTWDWANTPYQTMAADLRGDSRLELAVGNAVYDIDIQSRTDFSANHVTIASQVPSPSMVMEDGSQIPFVDGNTFLADINLDGSMDVIVMNVDGNARIIYLYVWDVATHTIICSKKITNARKFGMPQIGDLDNDNYPEICFITGTYSNHGTGTNDNIYALKYNPSSSNGAMEVFWSIPHEDNSASTGLTMFDFNQDGYVELIYRDVYNLRIINGSLYNHQTGQPVAQPYDLAYISCCSSTGLEYPVVADVDLDGEVEVVVGGETFYTGYGHLYIFKSAGIPWAPARKVWNQYMYNVTNVNEDLTIPQFQFNNATAFTDPQGVVRRPFNNFLQQATTIDQYGRPFYAVPDVAMEPSPSSQMVGDSIVLTFSYCNLGDNTLNAPYPVTVFANTYGGDTICTAMIEEDLPVDSCTQGVIQLPVSALCGFPDIDSLVIAVNGNTGGIAQNGGLQPECDTTNNTAAVAVSLHPDTTSLTATACDSHLWFGDTLTQSGEYTHTLTNSAGCDSVVTLTLHVLPKPAANITGPATICDGNAVTLCADSAVTYLWNTGETTRCVTVDEPGMYSVTVVDSNGCTNTTSKQVDSLDNPIVQVSIPEMCAGGTYPVSVGYHSDNNIQLSHGETTLFLIDTVFLPDGVYCEPYGCSYRSPLNFTAYTDGDVIQSVEDIYYVKLNIEHTFIGDLYINITCPNGQKADLLKYGGTGSSNCNSSISSSSRGWQTGSNASQGTDFGQAGSGASSSCNNPSLPGIGWNYCWSENTTQGYTYAPGAGSLLYRIDNVHNNRVDSSNVAAGTNFYHPDDSFTNLIGCPLNGEWYIEVQDGWSGDDGYLFGWELALSSEALSQASFEFDYADAEGPWLSVVNDSLFVLNPPADLAQDTVIAYTFHISDSTGCTFDTTINLTFYAIRHTDIDTTVCESFTWNDSLYTASGQYVQTFTSAVGCDSIVTVNLIVNHKTYGDTTVLACESFTWHGVEYTETPAVAPTDTITGGNHNGCDSIVTLHLTIHYGTHNVTNATACESYEWHGETYTLSDTYIYAYTNEFDCLSADTLHLTVNYATESTLQETVVENNLPYILNDSTYTLTGTYYQHFANAAGCDSTLTLQLTVYYNQTVETDSTVCENLLPLTWNDSVFSSAGTKTRIFPAANGADSIVVMTLHVNPLPVAAISGLTALCADSVVTLAADSAYSYLWSTGDTTRLITVAEEGAYSLTVTNQFGCEAVATHYLSALGNPILSVTAPEMCAGGSYTLSVGHQPYDNIQLGQGETTLSMTDTIFLPDGIYCEPYGCSYRSPLTFTAYNPGDTIQSADDIYYVRLNIEHSWIGDLYINITCPNGQKADLLKYGGLGTSECNQQIVASSRGWASGTNMAYSNYLGDAHDYDGNSCDASVFGNEPGIGWNYCWSDNTTQGYTYAPGAGSLIYRAENAHNGIVDSSNAAAGAHFYHPDDPFTNLIGCPLNGDWFIEVQDGWNIDNGYIFGWELALSSEALPDMDYVFDYSTADGPWLTTLSDSLFQIDPPADLEHDTTVAYTFTIYDTTGCGYDTTVFITFYATRHTDIDTSVCESFTWNDSVYTLSGQYVQTFVSAVGCDSIVTVNLIVNTKTYGDTTVVACESFTWRGVEYTATPTVAPTYTITGGNYNGCDSIVTLHLTVNHKTYGDTTAVACESFTWHGVSYTTTPATAPTYTITGGNHNGCDSIVTLHLTVNHKTYGDTTAVACEGFTWHGVSYTETPAVAPTYTMIGGNHSGCDSIVTLHLTVHHSTHNVSEKTACESYEWHGTTYTVSGTYTYAYSNENGCASVDTLHLTVHYGTHNVIDTTVCESYEWHGETYTETDTYTYLYTNADDCPSADTLHLTVSPAYEFSFEDVICEGDAYYEHGFVILPTQTIGVTDIDLTHELQSVYGCDSVVRLTLSVIDTAIRIVPLTADFCDNMSMELTVETGMPDYVWSTGEDAPTITVTVPGYYSVTATEGGCTVTARYHVDKCEYELVLPNAITPSNLDGVNDYFSLPESFLNEIALFEIAIFNRWGEMVYYSTNKGFRWNGEYRGEIQYQTIYNYVIKYTDTSGRQYRRAGSITVL